MSKTNEINVSDEDQSEIDTFVQLGNVEGGEDLIESIVKDSFTEAQAHVVNATIDLNNRESYTEILKEKDNE